MLAISRVSCSGVRWIDRYLEYGFFMLFFFANCLRAAGTGSGEDVTHDGFNIRYGRTTCRPPKILLKTCAPGNQNIKC